MTREERLITALKALANFEIVQSPPTRTIDLTRLQIEGRQALAEYEAAKTNCSCAMHWSNALGIKGSIDSGQHFPGCSKVSKPEQGQGRKAQIEAAAKRHRVTVLDGLVSADLCMADINVAFNTGAEWADANPPATRQQDAVRNFQAGVTFKENLDALQKTPPEVTALYEAAKEWCSDTEEDCGHHAEWKALSEALASYESARGKA